MKAAKNSAFAPEDAATLLAPWAAVADQGRQQMAVATESAFAMFRGLEAIRKIQEHAANDVLERHQAALDKLNGQHEPAEVMNLQAELLQSDLQDAARCLQEVAGAALEMQTEMVSCGSRLIGSASVLEAASAVDELPAAGLGSGDSSGRKTARRTTRRRR